MQFEPGSQFDRYTIEALLGEGGMGRVYRAFDARLERRVALKILRPSDAEVDSSRAVERILREARAAAALDHPNAVAIFELGEHDGVPFMAMELISGSSMRAFVGRVEVSIEQRLGWLIGIAKALDAAHHVGIVHLDVKPENVMIRSDGVVKVLDFGIARRTAFDPGGGGAIPHHEKIKISTLTGGSALVGTLPYMAPEQIKQRPLDGRTDQFAWGVLAFELLTGRLPWPTDGRPYDMLYAIINSDPPALRVPGCVLPEEIEAIVRRALSKQPQHRFESMGNIVEELEEALLAWRTMRRGATASPPTSGAGQSRRGGAVLPDTVPVDLDGAGAAIETRPATGPYGAPDTRPRSSAGAAVETRPVSGPISGPTTQPRPHTGDPRSRPHTGDPRSQPRPHTGDPRSSPSRPPGPMDTLQSAPIAHHTADVTAALADPGADAARPSLPAEDAPRRPPSRWRVAIGFAGAALVAALGVAALRPPPSPTIAPPPAPVAPTATAITDLPPPARCTPDALAEYRAGLQALRDGIWEQAHPRFERAIEIDPQCAAAHLRLAITGHTKYPASTTREIYRRAVLLRADLHERDQLLLNALEPLIRQDPSNKRACWERLRALEQRYPEDAEIAFLAARNADDLDRKVESAKRAIALDPTYSDAYQTLSNAYAEQGKLDEALVALDDCIRAAPNTADCPRARNGLLRRRGRCVEMVSNAQVWIARDPSTTDGYLALAHALAAQGAKRSAVEEALRQRWAKLPEAQRARRELFERGVLGVLHGDFDGAAARARELAKVVEHEPNFDEHVPPTMLRLGILRETGRVDEAGALAVETLDRKQAWSSRLIPEALEVAGYAFEPRLLAAAREAGLIPEPRWRHAQSRWLDTTREAAFISEDARWAFGTAELARTPEEASDALRTMPRTITASGGFLKPPGGMSGAFAGRALLLAGKSADAIPLLRVAAASCYAFDDPFLHTETQLWLGQALEAQQDTRGACEAYQLVLDRWGHARPRSTSADRARARMTALGCR